MFRTVNRQHLRATTCLHNPTKNTRTNLQAMAAATAAPTVTMGSSFYDPSIAVQCTSSMQRESRHQQHQQSFHLPLHQTEPFYSSFEDDVYDMQRDAQLSPEYMYAIEAAFGVDQRAGPVPSVTSSESSAVQSLVAESNVDAPCAKATKPTERKKRRTTKTRPVSHRLPTARSISTVTASDQEEQIALDESQQHVVTDVLHNGRSVFITGSAGCGKSALLRAIVKRCDRKTLVVTGSTGVAAKNVDGVTIHSFAGIGVGKGDVDVIVKKATSTDSVVRRWKRCKILVIDEISMVSERLFTVMDRIAKKARQSTEPFGGIQLVLSGDFYQLPPVIGKHCFMAQAWKDANVRVHSLQQNYRQADTDFRQALEEVRVGSATKETLALLEARDPSSPSFTGFDASREPVSLRSTRAEAADINNERFHMLEPQTRANSSSTLGVEVLDHETKELNPLRPVFMYHACDFKHKKKRTTELDFRFPEVLGFKVGVRVMLIRNLTSKLINGTTGTVVGFLSTRELVELATLIHTVLPRLLAKQKPKPQTFRALESRLQYLIEKGGFGTQQEALNAVVTMPGVRDGSVACWYLLDPAHALEKTSVLLKQAAGDGSAPLLEVGFKETEELAALSMSVQQLSASSSLSIDAMFPIIRCRDKDNNLCEHVAVSPLTEEILDADGDIAVSRTQFPLVHAWAITVHKAQGKMLPCVDVDMKNFFSKGQAYTALSRAPSLEALVLHNVSHRCFMSCEEAASFARKERQKKRREELAQTAVPRREHTERLVERPASARPHQRKTSERATATSTTNSNAKTKSRCEQSRRIAPVNNSKEEDTNLFAKDMMRLGSRRGFSNKLMK